MSNRSSRARHGHLLVILCIAFALRLISLTFQPLWFDEGWSVWFANSALTTMMANTAKDIHPPFYYALLHFWVASCGSGEFALRYLSVLIGVVSLAVLYRFTADLFDKQTGSLVALLAAVSPLQIYYAQEIRMYGLVTLLGLASSWLFWRANEVPSSGATGDKRDEGDAGDAGDKRKYWLAYVVVTSAAMYTQYYGAFIPLFHGIYWLFSVLRNIRLSSTRPLHVSSFGSAPDRRFTLHPWTRKQRWLRTGASHFTLHASSPLFPFISFISIVLLYIPWLLYVTTQLTQYVADKVNIEKYAPLAPLDYLWRHLVAFSIGHLSADSSYLTWVTLIFAGLLLLGLPSANPFYAIRNTQYASSKPQSFLLAYFLIPILAAYLIQLRFPFAPSRMERLLLLASSPFLMLVAKGIQRLKIKDWGLSSNVHLPTPNSQLPTPNFQLPTSNFKRYTEVSPRRATRAEIGTLKLAVGDLASVMHVMDVSDWTIKDKPYDLRERLFNFACVITRVAKFLHTQGPIAVALSAQLLRSGTSAGANHEEADDGSSPRMFGQNGKSCCAS